MGRRDRLTDGTIATARYIAVLTMAMAAGTRMPIVGLRSRSTGQSERVHERESFV